MNKDAKVLIHLFLALFLVLTGCSPKPTLINSSAGSNNSSDPKSGTTASESLSESEYSSFSADSVLGSGSDSGSEETGLSSNVSSGTVINSQSDTNTNPYKGKTVYVIDISTMSDYEKAAVTVLQGIANRNGPNIFLLPGNSSELSKLTSLITLKDAYSSSVINNYPYTEQFWIDYYTRIFGFTFQTVSFEQAVNKFSDLIKGVVYYDSPSFPAVAITAGGIYDAIPVNSDIIAHASYLNDLPVKLDLRNKFTDKYDAHEIGRAHV